MLLAIFLAVGGVATMMFAALATEPEDIWRRTIFGVAGLTLLIFGIYLL